MPLSPPELADELASVLRSLDPNRRTPEFPRGRPDQVETCRADRVVLAGGEFAARLAHPSFVPYEQLFRKRCPAGMYSATSQAPYRMELGAIIIPQQMVLAICDYAFTIYRPSGAAAGDFVPLESRRLSTQIGYDITISSYRTSNLKFELQPSLPGSGEGASAPPLSAGTLAAGADFSGSQPSQIGAANPFFPPSSAPYGGGLLQAALAQAAQGTQAAGLSLLPQRRERQGAPNLPFSMLVRESQRAAFAAVAVASIPIPLGFIECDVTGVLMPINVLEELLTTMAPCVPGGSL